MLEDPKFKMGAVFERENGTDIFCRGSGSLSVKWRWERSGAAGLELHFLMMCVVAMVTGLPEGAGQEDEQRPGAEALGPRAHGDGT